MASGFRLQLFPEFRQFRPMIVSQLPLDFLQQQGGVFSPAAAPEEFQMPELETKQIFLYRIGYLRIIKEDFQNAEQTVRFFSGFGIFSSLTQKFKIPFMQLNHGGDDLRIVRPAPEEPF